MKRTNKSEQANSRTDRMFQKDGNWYFRTREGGTAGPFRDELEAATQLEVYIRLASSDLLPLQTG